MKKFNWNNSVTWKGLCQLYGITAGIAMLMIAGYMIPSMLEINRMKKLYHRDSENSSEKDEAE